MINEIYQKVITPANKSPDGETPTLVVVTEEANCFAVWLTGHEYGYRLLSVEWNRDTAIECGVRFGAMPENELALLRMGLAKDPRAKVEAV